MDIFWESKSIYFGQKSRDERFETVDTTYLFTNEIISGYMPDLAGKRVLAIGGSGDHYFNARLNHAKQVDLFDIDYIHKFVIHLKKAGFEHLDYDTFCTFFGLYSIYHVFDYSIYRSFCQYLDEESYAYWNYIYRLAFYQGYSIYKSDLISNYHQNLKRVISANLYFNESEYLRLQSMLADTSDIPFIHTDIHNLPNLIHGKYDVMFLSNISTYQSNTMFMKTLKKLAKFLNENGQIYFAYIFENASEKAAFYHQLLNSSHYQEKWVHSGLEKGQNHKVYIYQK